ncbi:unnamed protein product [Brachionus calyciflorus]|uniref:Integrase catalytic domain-containing protein n=1 Tax=Brachionus calyciflorus TaxID=104777 RepID=A0A814R9F6_9BILA|nr:unnamed protein product [Brachionus calyciflorus]
MKYTKKWMVIPFNSLKTDYKNDTKKKILSNKKLSKEDKITMFNNLVQKNLKKNIPGQPMSENTPGNYDQNSIDEEVQSVKNEYDEFQDQNTYDWIKEESLTPFSADLRRFSNMLNKTLKNFNQSNNFTPRNISMNESNNDLSDFTLRENSLNNSRYSNKDPSDFSLRNISLNDSNNSMNEDDSILNQSIFQKPPAETTRSKRPISDKTYREITEVAKKKKKVNEIRELNSRPKKRKPTPASFTGHASFKHTVRDKNKLNDWLLEQEPYTLHRPLRKKFLREKVISNGINDLYQADLVDVSNISKENRGYKFLLTVIDVFSKFAWVKPIKNKTSESIRQALTEIFK